MPLRWDVLAITTALQEKSGERKRAKLGDEWAYLGGVGGGERGREEGWEMGLSVEG